MCLFGAKFLQDQEEQKTVYTKRHWRFQDVGVARIIGHSLRKSVGIKHSMSQRKAVCAAGNKTEEIGLPN